MLVQAPAPTIRRTLLLGTLLIGLPSPGHAQGMALTALRTPPPPSEAPSRHQWALVRPAGPATGPATGRLPNQATGPKRERAIRDICIGCEAR